MHYLIIMALVLLQIIDNNSYIYLSIQVCGIMLIKNLSFSPNSLVKGDTAASLPIISYSLTSYSPYVAELLVEANIELIAKNDLRFIDTVYKVMLSL